MPITDIAIRKAKPNGKPLRDGGGLYLLPQTNGRHWWRLDYRIAGKRKTISMGVYPEVALKDARKRREEARELVAAGVDPSSERKAGRAAHAAALADTFKEIAIEWLAMRAKTLAPITITKAKWMLETFAYPEIGDMPIRSIETDDLLRLLRKIEERGFYETAHRTRQRCQQVFKYARQTRKGIGDPTADLERTLVPVKSTSRAAITDPAKLRGLLLAIDGYDGGAITGAALKLSALTFVRPGELRAAEWSELDLESREPTWRIPAAKMKMKAEHIVPLSAQAVAAFRGLQPQTGTGTYVFPSLQTRKRCMSDGTVNAALRRMGFDKATHTAHGFRTTASTLLNEQAWRPDLIERQLAHIEKDNVRAAYNKAQHLPERRKMMCAWADYLDGLKAASNVTPIRSRAKV